MRAVLLVGLPGSGKTYTAVHEYVPQGFVLVDDPRTKAEVMAAMALGKDLVFTDPFLTITSNRHLAERDLRQAGFEIEWVFFENDPEKARTNVERRDAVEPRPYKTDVFAFSRTYKVPDGVAVRPIWTP